MNDSEQNMNAPDAPKGSAIKGILVGAITDILGSLGISVVLTIIYMIILFRQGLSADEISKQFQMVNLYSAFSITGIFCGTLWSVFAGFLCASISMTNIHRNSAILSAISCSSGLIVGYKFYSTTENIFLLSLTALAIFFGGYLWKNQQRKLEK